MNDELQNEIQRRIDAFAKDITKLLQGAVNDALAGVLAGQGRSSSTSADAPRGRRGRKPAISEDVLLAEIKKQGGRRMEHLAKALGIPSIKLKGPIKRLVAAKRVTTKGRRRGMTYTAK